MCLNAYNEIYIIFIYIMCVCVRDLTPPIKTTPFIHSDICIAKPNIVTRMLEIPRVYFSRLFYINFIF